MTPRQVFESCSMRSVRTFVSASIRLRSTVSRVFQRLVSPEAFAVASAIPYTKSTSHVDADRSGGGGDGGDSGALKKRHGEIAAKFLGEID